jgi:hypothetical protein
MKLGKSVMSLEVTYLIFSLRTKIRDFGNGDGNYP